jgi:periplasmic protein CpxP/Spy
MELHKFEINGDDPRDSPSCLVVGLSLKTGLAMTACAIPLGRMNRYGLKPWADGFSRGHPSRPIPITKINLPRKRCTMTPDELNNIAVELKRLGSELNLSDNQKEELRTFLTEKYQKLQEYRKQNPNVSKEDVAQYVAKNRSAGREKLEKFLTPEQLTKWDAEIAKAKDFLSQRAASA